MKTTQNNKQSSYSALFSLEVLERISHGDQNFIIDMLNQFIAIALECSDIMRSAVANNDWKKLKVVAHKNIPSYSIMGLDDLMDLLKDIENNAQKEEKREDVKKLVEIIIEKNNAVIESIHDYLEHIPI